ncbi:hypothetical protein [Methylobacterium brachythecii]|uniref:Uncharacterized protein n=1 Tax=Methylobacterium brachythecii TaxID=1176177 RepID=A0A7W6AJQ8_9HYPH|nr:hypothetical protein [Methylobacterium brachythecii]MBB3902595.1 hypothetical protein [Methylobacterium brachythecii]GLS42439.1 hypothetical protein GCM10007884_04240 [Methylobacterium brachythecii]
MFLLLSVCLLAEPSKCHEERINLSFDNQNPAICLRNSQATLAQWAGEHPDLTIKSWRCASKAKLQNDL